MRLLIVVAAITLLNSSAMSQHPYAGLQNRSIKTLSDQQIADLNAGRGMGLALAAELNGYPGPIHAIELAEQLHLSSDQVSKLKSLFEAMKAESPTEMGAEDKATKAPPRRKVAPKAEGSNLAVVAD